MLYSDFKCLLHTHLSIFIEIQAIGNYSLFLGDDDGICVAVLLQWKDLNLLYHNITVVPDTLFDIRHDSISIKVIYHTLYNVSVVHNYVQWTGYYTSVYWTVLL